MSMAPFFPIKPCAQREPFAFSLRWKRKTRVPAVEVTPDSSKGLNLERSPIYMGVLGLEVHQMLGEFMTGGPRRFDVLDYAIQHGNVVEL